MADMYKQDDSSPWGLLPGAAKLFTQAVLAASFVVPVPPPPPAIGAVAVHRLGLGHKNIARVRLIPDLTGATPDITLWTFLCVTVDNVVRTANLANNFTLEYDPRRLPSFPIDVIPYYAGVNIGGLNAGNIVMEALEV